MLNRRRWSGGHRRRCTAGFADGHPEALRVSAIGLQHYPGRTLDGKAATALTWLGGKDLYDDRWMWSFPAD